MKIPKVKLWSGDEPPEKEAGTVYFWNPPGTSAIQVIGEEREVKALFREKAKKTRKIDLPVLTSPAPPEPEPPPPSTPLNHSELLGLDAPGAHSQYPLRAEAAERFHDHPEYANVAHLHRGQDILGSVEQAKDADRLEGRGAEEFAAATHAHPDLAPRDHAHFGRDILGPVKEAEDSKRLAGKTPDELKKEVKEIAKAQAREAALRFRGGGGSAPGVFSTSSAGLVPQPKLADAGRFLRGDATWQDVTGGPGATDHGALTGLADDDHPQYVLAVGGRPITGTQVINTLAVDDFMGSWETGTPGGVVSSLLPYTDLAASLGHPLRRWDYSYIGTGTFDTLAMNPAGAGYNVLVSGLNADLLDGQHAADIIAAAQAAKQASVVLDFGDERTAASNELIAAWITPTTKFFSVVEGEDAALQDIRVFFGTPTTGLVDIFAIAPDGASGSFTVNVIGV